MICEPQQELQILFLPRANHRIGGKSQFPPVRKEEAWPAIADAKTFERVQTVLNSRAPKVTHPRATASHYLLSGIIRCRKCGASYIGYGAKSGRSHYYVCVTAYSKGREACNNQHLPKERLEQFVVDKTKSYILSDGHLAELATMINDEMGDSVRDHKERIHAIDAEINHWQDRLDRLYDFVETKAIEPVRMAQRIAQVQDKVEEMRRVKLDAEEALHSYRVQAIDPQTVLDYVKDLRAFLDECSIFERRAFLRSFIDSIDVDDGQIALNYTLPLPPDNTKQEAVSVLGIVPFGGAEGIRTHWQVTFHRSIGRRLCVVWSRQKKGAPVAAGPPSVL